MFSTVRPCDPRELAVRVLLRRENASEYVEDLLAAELAEKTIAPSDRGLLQELVYGAVRWQAPLDWLIARKTAGRTQKAALQILLRLALYQLFWLERIPDHAAVHETVALAKRLGFGPQAGFVNAVLRSYLRERPQTEHALEQLKLEQPPLGGSHPEWLFARWEKRWGREKAVNLMDWNNRPAKTYARWNALRSDAAALRSAWKAEGVAFEEVRVNWAPDGLLFELIDHPPLVQLRSFQEGFFYVQDPSTILAVAELDPRADEQVLDLCAAPGGKATFMAQRMRNHGRILTLDLQPDRLELIKENCARLGVSNVEVKLAPTGSPPTNAAGEFDRVLLDAPCSNTGVIRRRLDLRWRVRPQELERLQSTQLHLTCAAAAQVKPGGRLVYSTCSLEPEENGDVVGLFLKKHPEFALERERELLPFVDGFDGAYVATLARAKD